MKKFNLNEFIWFLILLGFSSYLGYLMYTGKINYFIHPKMLKYTIVSFIGFIVLTLYQFAKAFSGMNRKSFKKGYLLFLLPLILSFVPSKGLDSSIANKKGVSLSASDKVNLSNDTANAQSNYINDNTVIFDDDRYYSILDNICGNVNKYKGKKVIIKGFVFKDKNYEKDQFVVARMMMTCCAADAQVIGLMGKWDNAPSLIKDEWVNVEGKIDTIEYKDKVTNQESSIPVILVDKVEKTEKPSNQIIYP